MASTPNQTVRDEILSALTAVGHMITIDEIRFFRDPTKDTTALSQLCDSLEAAWDRAAATAKEPSNA